VTPHLNAKPSRVAEHDRCWKATGPVTYCGKPAEHSIHHIQPDTFRFHPFQAQPDREQRKRFKTTT
jgi:hypothetical protein